MLRLSRTGWLAGLLLGFAILGTALGSVLGADAMVDFRAFWCGGVTVAHHLNPYLQQPLQRCEQTAGPPWEVAPLSQVALPAPLPPYALLAYAAFASLSFPIAITLYSVALIAALTAAIELLAHTIKLPSLTIAAALAPTMWSLAILRGQGIPLVLLAIAGAAFFAQRRRPIPAALCVTGAMIEPHVALPAVLALFALWPRTRIAIVVALLALGMISVAAVGFDVTLSYVRDVLPAHAFANAYEPQLSLTSLLTYFGVAPSVAISLGTVSYVVMTCLGILVASRLVYRDHSLVPAVLVPPAFGLFLGVHVHYHQLVLAFPAVLYILRRSRPFRGLAAGGLIAAMLPWETIVAPGLIGLWALIAGTFGRFAFDARRGLLIALAIAAFAISMSLTAFLWPALGAGGAPFIPHPYPPSALAEVSWTDYSRQELSRCSPLLLWLRVPTILGFASSLVAVVLAALAPSAKEVLAAKASALRMEA